MELIDELRDIEVDLANLARLASNGAIEDVRLLLAKLVRKYRGTHPELASQLDTALKSSRTRSNQPNVLRRDVPPASGSLDAPIDADSRLALLRIVDDLKGMDRPLLPLSLLAQLQNIGKEHQQRQRLLEHGIEPTKSAILIGPPGVGKTMSARWLATQLNKPLWILDLSTVMSSLLGKTGANLRSVFDFAKKNDAVLLLDEIDAIAKRRNDESDVGELKRLVTVILQEVDAWPSTGLLLAATNHPELIDPALWRRFDSVLEFNQPAAELLEAAIKRFFGQDCNEFESSIQVLKLCFENNSFSNVERAINSIRRDKVLNNISSAEAVFNFAHSNFHSLSKQARHDLAIELAKSKDISHNRIMALTGVSRDTIRKYAGPSPIKGRGLKKLKENNG